MNIAQNGHSATSSFSDSRSNLSLYLREIGQYKLLTRSEEIKLAEESQKGNVSAREQMILSNLRLVVKIARDYEGFGLPLLDLINEGNLGLMKSVERFDPAFGAKISTYAAWWIKQRMKIAVANQGKTIRLPVHAVGKVFYIRRASIRLSELLGREPTLEEIGLEINMTPEKVSMYLDASGSAVSLETPIGNGEDGLTLSSVVKDESAVSPSARIEDHSMHVMLENAMGALDPREISIIKARFGLESGEVQTLEEVGTRLNVTRERVRQIEYIALRKLRQKVKLLEEEATKGRGAFRDDDAPTNFAEN